MTPTKPNNRGWSLPEALILSVLLTVLVCALVVASSDQRRRSRLAASHDNLKFFGSGTESYAADTNGEFWTYTWLPNVQYAPWVGPAATRYDAASNQAIDIIRRNTPRTDLGAIGSWIPHLLYRHLPLLDYLGLALPSQHVVSPEDRVLTTWQRNALSNNLRSLPSPPPDSGQFTVRWAYSSSYESGAAFWSRDSSVVIDGVVHSTFTQGPTHNGWNAPSSVANPSPILPRRIDSVQFPSDKAHMWDRYQRHFGPQILFFAYTDARLPVLMADGSVSVRTMSSVNPGFVPSSPTSPNPTMAGYQPDTAWEPPTRSGATSETLRMHLRFTRWGLRGRDFNGPEVFNP
jgi:hypothetical protein